MSKMPWFRAYTEMIDDEKLRLLAFEDRWHFVAIMCLKGQGVLDGNDPLMMRKAAVKMGLDLRTLEEVARRLEEVGLIDKETLEPLQWESRQMRSDADTTAADRKRRQREREKADLQPVENKGTNSSHDDVTDESRVTVTNVTRTEVDTDKEEETKTKPRARAAAPAVDFSEWPSQPSDEVWADYVKHRKAKKAPLTQTAVNGIGREARKAWAMGYSVDDFLTECMQRGWQGGKADWLEGSPQKGPVRPQTQAQRNADWTAELWRQGARNERDMGVIDATAN